MAAPQNKGQGQAGGPIHAPKNIAPDSGGTMFGREISDSINVDGGKMPFPPKPEGGFVGGLEA